MTGFLFHFLNRPTKQSINQSSLFKNMEYPIHKLNGYITVKHRLRYTKVSAIPLLSRDD